MRVLIDTTYAERAPYSGTAVYLERLRASLGELNAVEVGAVSNERRPPPGGGGLGSMRNLLVDRLWQQVGLARAARSAGVDVLHHPLPAHSRRAGVAQVITVHDLAFERLPACFDRAWRSYAHLAHRAAARAADAVICVSETTAEDVRALWGVSEERIVVAPHGPGQLTLERPRVHSAEHFLYVGDDEPRKQVATLLEAYGAYRERAHRPLQLVLAGSAQASGAGIRVETGPDRARIADLYRRAAALVHPSLYEGFGLTALEAMSAGTPVLAARSPGTTEVCADAARYVEPRNAEALAVAMSEVGASARLQAELSRRGVRRAASFSWEASAQAHAEAYSRALRAFRRVKP